MKLVAHFCLWAAAPFAMAVLLSGFAGAWFGEEGVLQLSRWIIFETRRTEALEHRSEMIARSDEIKRAIIAELSAGNLTLHEAALQFHEANRMVENTDRELVADYQMPVTDDGLYRQVIAWVQGESAILSPERAERLLAPLVQEYESLFGPLESADELLETASEPPESAEEPPLLLET